MVCEVSDPERVKDLFAGWQETCVWSCLQGVMGRLYADSEKDPRSAMAILGDFCFFAGKPDLELVSYKPKWCTQDFIIMTALSPEWIELIERVYQEKAKKVSRYAMKKEPGVFDTEKLKGYVMAADREVLLHMIDEELFEACGREDWSRDFVAQYTDYEEFRQKGLGVVATKNGQLIAGASSYSSYQGGIEIEIDTKKEYRRQGLAAACGAKLILACLERGWYPSWDAQNLNSVALAEKLGYHFDHEYTAYEIAGY